MPLDLVRYKSHRYHTSNKKRYRLEQKPFKQTLVPWTKEQLVAEVGCLEADLRFSYIAHAGVPQFTDDLGLVDKLREKDRFKPEEIALFRAFLDEETVETNAANPPLNITFAESYLLDILFLAVLKIKLEKVLTTEDLNALENIAASKAVIDESTLPIAGKVCIYFTEHFNFENFNLVRRTVPCVLKVPLTCSKKPTTFVPFR